ncbi:MAG TPA: hypothetical protein VEQ42_05725, partial [Pyrinomonadaceae bacterium]|nr:hypothetical protein [Pyrinomonadaceae bacterium]
MNVENFIPKKRARHDSLVKTLGVLTLLLALAASATAQTTPPPSATEELRKLDFLVGEWKGKGWMLGPNGARLSEMSQSV